MATVHFLISGLRLSEAAQDVKSLVKLTDEWVNQTIRNSEDEQAAGLSGGVERNDESGHH